MRSRSSIMSCKCQVVFCFQYDRGHRGEIKVEDFRRLLRHPQVQAEIDRHTLDVLEVKATDPMRQTVSYQEFINIVSRSQQKVGRVC